MYILHTFVNFAEDEGYILYDVHFWDKYVHLILYMHLCTTSFIYNLSKLKIVDKW